MIKELEPRPEQETPSAFGVSMSGPFAASGRAIFDAYVTLGGIEPVYVGGFRCAGLDPTAVAVVEDVLRGRGSRSSAPVLDKPGYDGILLVSSEEGLAGAWGDKCAPEPGECCIFVDSSAGRGSERCEVIVGSRVCGALESLLAEPGRSESAPRVGSLIAEVLRIAGDPTTEELLRDGRLAAGPLAQTLPFFGFGLAFYDVVIAVLSLVRRLPDPAKSQPGEAESASQLQALLDRWIPRFLSHEAQNRYATDDGTGDRSEILDFETDVFTLAESGVAGVEALFKPLRSAYASLPDAAWAFGILYDELATDYARSRILDQAEANLVFQFSVVSTVLSMRGLGEIVKGNARAAQQHEQQLRDLAIGGAIIGTTCFTFGTIYGVIYDIVDTFVSVIYYTFVGIRWVFYQAKAALDAALAEPEVPAASDETVAAWFPIFDLDTFFAEELPELYASAKEFSYRLRDDFINNAALYGEMVGEYLTSALGSTLESTLALVFDPYDPNAGYLDRIWYVVKQWFYLGSVLGPIIIDLVLTFGSGGGGVVAAALKLGKIDKLKDVFRITKVGEGVVESFAFFKRIVAFFPDELLRITKVVERVLEKVWAAIGPIRDQLMTVLTKLQQSTPDVDVAWWATQIDEMYDRASTINFLVGIFLLVTGTAEVDGEGATYEPAP
jgi:hypothetical protein